MKKNIVKINENTLRQIVAESVKTVLKEGYSNEQIEQYKKAYDMLSEIVRVLMLAAYKNRGNKRKSEKDRMVIDCLFEAKRHLMSILNYRSMVLKLAKDPSYERLLDETGLSGFDPTAN